MAVELAFVRPPSKPADVPLRIYSNPICPYAEVCRCCETIDNLLLFLLRHIILIFIEGSFDSCFQKC